MRLFVALFVLLACLRGTAAQTVCDDGTGRVTVCLELGADDWITNTTLACLAGEDLGEGNITGEAETSNVTLQIRKGLVDYAVYRVAPQLVVATCTDSEVTFEIESAMGPEDGIPAYITSLSHAITLIVKRSAAGALELTWYGEIVSGQIVGIYTEFNIRREKDAASTNMTVGLMTPASESAPGLPAVLEFEGDMIPLLTRDMSCPYTTLAPARALENYEGPVVELAETDEPVLLEYGYFDPCLARRIADRNCTEDPAACTTLNKGVVIALSTIVGEPVQYGGVSVENLDVQLMGTFIWQGEEISTEDAATEAAELASGRVVAAEDLDEEESGEVGVLNGISWNGTITADVRVFKNFVAFGTGDIVNDMVELEVDFAFETTTTKVNGSLLWNSECLPANATAEEAKMLTEAEAANSGPVNLTLLFVGAEIAGLATQQNCDEWLITGTVVGERIFLHGRYLKWSTVAVSVTSSETDGVPGIKGTIVGPVEMGNFINATGTISFTGDAVESFAIVGSVHIDGFVNGSLEFNLEKYSNKFVGKGSVTFITSNGVIPLLDGTVSYVTSPAADDAPIWMLTGQLASLVLYDIELTKVNVTLFASAVPASVNTTSSWLSTWTWSGIVEGTIVVDGSSVDVKVPIDNNNLQDMEGHIHLVGRNLTFDGTFHLDETSNSTGCAGLSFDAAGTLRAGNYTFSSTLMSHGCAGAGEPLYSVMGSTEEKTMYHDLSLSKMTIELEAFGKECDDDSCDATDVLFGVGPVREIAEWRGHIAGNSEIFGGTSTVCVAFKAGLMGAMQVSTLFHTEPQVLSGKLWVTYNQDRAQVSRGEGEMKLRLAGAQTLNVSGPVSVVAQTGEVHFRGVYDGVWRSASGYAKRSELSLSLPKDEAAAMPGLGARVWTGSLTTTALDDGTTSTMQLDTSKTDTSFVAIVEYSDPVVTVTGELSNIDGTCVGSASIVVGNLPHGLSTLEVEGDLEVEGCVQNNAWVATGTLAWYVVPVYARSLNLTNVVVTASRTEANGPVVGSIRGTWRNDFFVTVEFSSDTVRISGGVLQGTKSISWFLTAWNSGTPALPVVLGTGSPGLFEDLRGMKLAAVKFEFLFDTEEVVLTGSGSLYGSGFDATLLIKKQGKQWAYGIHASSQDKNGPVLARVTDGMLGNVLTKLSPTEIAFTVGSTSLSKCGVVAKGVTFKGGMMLEVLLKNDNELIQTALARSPAAMAAQIEAVAEASGAYRVSAALTNVSEVHVSTALQGNLRLGTSAASITKLSLDLWFTSLTGAPSVGFLSTLQCTLASAPNDVQFTSTGFIALPTSAGGALVIESWSVTRPDSWVDAFGVAGITVLFGQKFGLKMTSALEPTEFSLVGNCEVANTVNACTISAPMPDFTKPVVLTNAGEDLEFIVAELSDCPGCISTVGKVLSNATMEAVAVTANVVSPSPITVAVGGVQKTLPPGVVVRAGAIRFWEVITVRSLEFEVTKTGVDREFVTEPVLWGPITITSAADAAKGPFLLLSLKKPSPEVKLNGAATIWGNTRPVSFHFCDKVKSGRFSVPLAGATPAASLDAAIVVTSAPGQAAFSNRVEGVVSVDPTTLAADATAWLVDLKASAEKALDKSLSLLLEGRAVQSSKTTACNEEQLKWVEQLSAWTGRIAGFTKKVKKTKKACKALKKTCSTSKAASACAQYTACLTQLTEHETAEAAAKAKKAATETSADEQILIAKAQSQEANETVARLEAGLKAVTRLDSGFKNMTAAAGGDLADAMSVTSITFRAPLSPTFSAVNVRADAIVLGKELRFEFESDLTYPTLRAQLAKKLRAFLKVTWGTTVVSL